MSPPHSLDYSEAPVIKIRGGNWIPKRLSTIKATSCLGNYVSRGYCGDTESFKGEKSACGPA